MAAEGLEVAVERGGRLMARLGDVLEVAALAGAEEVVAVVVVAGQAGRMEGHLAAGAVGEGVS